MGEMQVEELRGPFDTIIRRCRQIAQDLEGEGKDNEAQRYYLHINKIKEVKEDLLP
jgi:hypothetical protein